MGSSPKTFQDFINGIEIEDLQYIEADLCYYQQVSLALLLYGAERTHCDFILQKLIILSQNPPEGKGFKITEPLRASDILTNYATRINPNNWRVHIVEALAIIRAKSVLRKLGSLWSNIYHEYLPHVAEISVNIHPLLKALYKICERLNLEQAGRLINAINEKYNSPSIRFYDVSYLEIFILHWISQHIIDVGDYQLQGCNVQCLIEFFKFNDMDSIKDTLVESINQNLKDSQLSADEVNQNGISSGSFKDSGVSMSHEMCTSLNIRKEKIPQATTLPPTDEYDAAERYTIRPERAGYILIINQSKFHEDKNPELKEFLPKTKFKETRDGTDVDRDKLAALFSGFGYTPLVFNNLTHLEMKHHIRETAKKSLLRDSIIVCILSHGMEGVVYGCNSIPVTIAEIRDILTNEALKGKPKLLIIQACQKDVSPLDTSLSNIIRNFQPDAYADCLLALSAMPGTDAIRHTLSGSWFVQSLCNLTKKYAERKHMMDILTTVCNEVSKKKGQDNEVMLSTTQSSLRKDFYLPRPNNKNNK